MNNNYCEIVQASLSGERPIDEQTFASVSVLSERLERLKGLGSCFSGVAFSPAVKKLQKQKVRLAVG